MVVYLNMRSPDLVNFRKHIIGIGLLGLLFAAPSLKAQPGETAIKMDKFWSYISGPQRAVNDANRVNYLIGPKHSLGARVNNFTDLQTLDASDSQFMVLHLPASEVYEAEKTHDGPAFYISKTEVTNAQYRGFIMDCIAQWMRENRKEIASNYKWDSPEYIKAVNGWLQYDAADLISEDSLRKFTWSELWRSRNIDWKRITYQGKSIFPNTLVWVEDFAYSFNEPLTKVYFHHPAYDNFPVVGVSQVQATLFCQWKTKGALEISKSGSAIQYRLPSEAEWERAASVIAKKPLKKSSGSPVNNNFLRNAKGIYIANYHTAIGDFTRDGALYTTAVESYFPNDAGCYNMQGNVAEWTSNVMQIGNDDSAVKGYIIKGGAWNLPAAACTIGSRTFLPETSSTSYVGFRLVAVPMRKYKPMGTPEF
jgi:formylglycine-generating enzyme required for sulfatase activity